jgi:hypothetical protein
LCTSFIARRDKKLSVSLCVFRACHQSNVFLGSPFAASQLSAKRTH